MPLPAIAFNLARTFIAPVVKPGLRALGKGLKSTFFGAAKLPVKVAKKAPLTTAVVADQALNDGNGLKKVGEALGGMAKDAFSGNFNLKNVLQTVLAVATLGFLAKNVSTGDVKGMAGTLAIAAAGFAGISSLDSDSSSPTMDAGPEAPSDSGAPKETSDAAAEPAAQAYLPPSMR